ncbi:MAG: hypothetical protein JXA64_02065 [Candidatus Fermentibacteraceae bacterium]|nr:hypothetical protein [Candidatus Fermentibacteraceae bacterium]
MIGICIEAGLTCPGCENFVPVNAMVPTLRCNACGNEIKLSPENWSSLLGEALRSAPSYEEDQGSRMTIFGDYSFRITYGRQFPRYDGTKDTIEEELLHRSLGEDAIRHPVSGEPTGIRPLPGMYSEEFRGVVAIIGEDNSLLPGVREGTAVTECAKGPVAFQCPSCGGSLMLDGKNRTTTCTFCNTQVHLPDDLWFALHPVKTARRWYLLFDEMQRPLEWEREIWDAVRDEEGNYYMIVEPGIIDTTMVASTKPDRTLRWKRTDLTIEPGTSRGEPKLAVAGGHRLLVATGDRSKLFVISSTDGRTLKVLDEPENPSESRERFFSMKGCYDFAVFPDDTLFLYRDCDSHDTYGHYMNFQRFDMDGNLLRLWDQTKMRFTFFQKVKRLFSRNADPADFDRTPSYPTGTREFEIRLTAGPDGSLYMLNFKTLLKLDPNGRKVYLIEELPCNYTTGRPAVNDRGEAFVVANQDSDRVEILSVSPDGMEIRTEARSAKDGGTLERNGVLTISPDGTFSLIGYSGYWTDMKRQ